MLPFEFIVEGVPVSLQARRRNRLKQWKEKVHNAAQLRWPLSTPPVKEDIQIVVIYFYEEKALDVDNMIKPIQDALIGLVYDDDEQVTDIHASKRNLLASFILKDVSPALAQGIATGREFLYVRVDFPPTYTRLDYV